MMAFVLNQLISHKQNCSMFLHISGANQMLGNECIGSEILPSFRS